MSEESKKKGLEVRTTIMGEKFVQRAKDNMTELTELLN